MKGGLGCNNSSVSDTNSVCSQLQMVMATELQQTTGQTMATLMEEQCLQREAAGAECLQMTIVKSMTWLSRARVCLIPSSHSTLPGLRLVSWTRYTTQRRLVFASAIYLQAPVPKSGFIKPLYKLSAEQQAAAASLQPDASAHPSQGRPCSSLRAWLCVELDSGQLQPLHQTLLCHHVKPFQELICCGSLPSTCCCNGQQMWWPADAA